MKTRDAIHCLVWLEWPERCFRVDAKALSFLKSLLPRGATLVRARSEASFLRALPQATHVITWHFSTAWYARAPKLRVLATPSAGRELIAWRDAPEHVTVHFGGFHGPIIAESVTGFILAWAHGFFHPGLRDKGKGIRDKGEKEPLTPYPLPLTPQKWWPRVAISDSCFNVAGTRAVIVGYGKIGKAIGKNLEALGVEVVGFGRSAVYVSEGLSAETPNPYTLTPNPYTLIPSFKPDWLILALPSDTGTDHFLNRRLIAKLPRRCVVVNIGRGNAVDEAALVDALTKKRLAGAYLDVFQGEPGMGTGPTILGTVPGNLPANLVKMPHSSAFCDNYLQMCFQELKHDGLI